jgi:hypothetical protein
MRNRHSRKENNGPQKRMAALQKSYATECPLAHFPKRAGISFQGNFQSMTGERMRWTLPLDGKRASTASAWRQPPARCDFQTQFLFYLKSLADHGILQEPRNYCSFRHGTVAIHLHFPLASRTEAMLRMPRRKILSPAGE